MNPLSLSVEQETVTVESSTTKEVEEKVEETVECCIFLDTYPLADCIGCSNGHWVCKEALGKYLDIELEKPLEYHQALKGVKCPSCTDTFAGERLLELLSPEMREKYAVLRSKCSNKEKHEEEVAAKKPDDLEVLHESIRLQFTTGKGDFKGKMCPTCNFGPIEHFACENLKTHHRQQLAGGVQINNSCPLCSSFQKDIRHWKKWDGSFLTQDRMTAVADVSRIHQAKFEQFQKKLAEKLEADTKVAEAKVQEEVAKHKIAMDNYENYYPNHGVRAPHIVRREMSAAKGEEKIKLARECRKALRLWNKMPPKPEPIYYSNANQWVSAQKKKNKAKIREREQEMVKQIQADIKQLDAVSVQEEEGETSV